MALTDNGLYHISKNMYGDLIGIIGAHRLDRPTGKHTPLRPRCEFNIQSLVGKVTLARLCSFSITYLYFYFLYCDPPPSFGLNNPGSYSFKSMREIREVS